MKLVEKWYDCWKWFSVHALVLQGIFIAFWAKLTPDQISSLPQHTEIYVTVLIALLGLVGRLVKQEPATTL